MLPTLRLHTSSFEVSREGLSLGFNGLRRKDQAQPYTRFPPGALRGIGLGRPADPHPSLPLMTQSAYGYSGSIRFRGVELVIVDHHPITVLCRLQDID